MIKVIIHLKDSDDATDEQLKDDITIILENDGFIVNDIEIERES